jgi:hypothetical protein
MRATRPSVSIACRSFLVEDLHLGRRRGVTVADADEAEEVGRQLGAAGMEDEGALHAEDAAEQARLEHHVVPGRILSGVR